MKAKTTFIEKEVTNLIKKSTRYRILTKDTLGLTETEFKIYTLLHSTPNKVFTVIELSEESLLSKVWVTKILNKLEDAQLLPKWINRRRNLMSLRLVRRTPEQVKAEKEEAKVAAQRKKDYDKFSDDFDRAHLKCEIIAVPDTVDNIIQYWQNKSGISKFQMPEKIRVNSYLNPTKTYKNIVLQIKRLLAGTAFSKNEFVRKNRKFTIPEIKLAIDRFHTAATSDRHKPYKKDSMKRMGMFDFFYSQFFKDENFRSQFLYYLENEPTPRMELAENAPMEKNPNMTKILTNNVERVFGFDVLNDWKVRNSLVTAANKLYVFWIKHEKLQQWAYPLSANSLVREFITSLLEWSAKSPERQIVPQTLIQGFVFEIFERYCFDVDLLVRDESLSEDEEPLSLSEDIDGLEGLRDDKDYRTESELYEEPSTSDMTNLAAKLFPPEEPKEELSWENKMNEKKIAAEKERNQYENSPYD